MLFRSHGLRSRFPFASPAVGAGGGLKNKKPTARFASGGGLETFSILLAVFPIARSGNSLLHSRSRGSRLGRLGSNSLLGDGHHHKPEPTMPFSPRKGIFRIFRRPLLLSAFTLCLPEERSAHTVAVKGTFIQAPPVWRVLLQEQKGNGSMGQIIKCGRLRENLP